MSPKARKHFTVRCARRPSPGRAIWTLTSGKCILATKKFSSLPSNISVISVAKPFLHQRPSCLMWRPIGTYWVNHQYLGIQCIQTKKNNRVGRGISWWHFLDVLWFFCKCNIFFVLIVGSNQHYRYYITNCYLQKIDGKKCRSQSGRRRAW